MRADILNVPFTSRGAAQSDSGFATRRRAPWRIHVTSSALWLSIALVSIASWAGLVWLLLKLLRPVLAPF